VTYAWDVRAAHDEASYVSPQIETILGFSREEWGRTEFWRTRVHPDDRDDVFAATRRSATTGEPFSMEYRYLAKDGHVVWVLDQAILLERDEDGRPKVFHGLMLDITDRKEAEAKAIENEVRYRALASQIPAITYRWEREHDGYSFAHYVSEQVRTVLGYSPEEWTARQDFWVERLHPDDRVRVVDASNRAIASGGPFNVRYRLIAADGRTVWISDQGRAIEYDERGRPTVWQGIMLDVSDQELAQRGRRAAEQRFRALVEQLPAMVYIEIPTQASTESRLRYLSPQVETILGYTPAELIADPTHLVRMVHPSDRDRILHANEVSDATGDPFDEEYRVIAKDGRTVWVHSRASLVRDERGFAQYWLGVAIDVSDRHREPIDVRGLEDQLGR
jgi:PAS domain S-box-containing protein